MHCIFWMVHNIFRNRSFTLFKNDRDFSGRFDSVTLSESISSSSMTKLIDLLDGFLSTHGSLRSCSQHVTRFPLLRRPLVVNVPFWVVWWSGAHHRSPCSWLLLIQRAQKYVLTLRFGFHRAFRCSRGKHGQIPYTASRYQNRHRLWFRCDSFFTCVLFDITSR